MSRLDCWSLLSPFRLVHEDVKVCEGGRVFLRCLRCQRETEGWTIEPKPLAFERRRPVTKKLRAARSAA